jgi:hypothetical protein
MFFDVYFNHVLLIFRMTIFLILIVKSSQVVYNFSLTIRLLMAYAMIGAWIGHIPHIPQNGQKSAVFKPVFRRFKAGF